MLTPLTAFFAGSINTVGVAEYTAGVSYPFYRSRIGPLTGIDLSYETDFKDYFPGLGFRFGVPRHNLSHKILFSQNTNGTKNRLNYQFVLSNASINVGAQYADRFDITQTLRGFSRTKFTQATGSTVSIDLIHKLFKYRDGLHSPNVFIADIYGSLFIDYVSLPRDSIAYGYELQAETGVAMRVPLILKFGYATKEGEHAVFFGFTILN